MVLRTWQPYWRPSFHPRPVLFTVLFCAVASFSDATAASPNPLHAEALSPADKLSSSTAPSLSLQVATGKSKHPSRHYKGFPLQDACMLQELRGRRQGYCQNLTFLPMGQELYVKAERPLLDNLACIALASHSALRRHRL